MLGTNNAQNLFRQSYSRGVVIFFYGLLWLAAMLAGYVLLDPLFAAGSALLAATWASALAGGLGGATAMLSRLYQHTSIEQDFHRQSVFTYLVQPLLGLVIGILVLYVIAIPGAMVVNYTTSRNLPLAAVLALPTFGAIHILLSWIGGFYQQRGLDKIKLLARRSGKSEPAPAASAAPALDVDAPLFFKAWLRRQRQMIAWSYTWGLFLLGYALLWMVGLLASILATGGLFATLEQQSGTVAAQLVIAAWPVAAAGGLGGVCSLLYDLFWHVSYKQDFHRQYLMSYLVQPAIGVVFGLVMYLLLASGYLSVAVEEGGPPVVDSLRVVMLQILLGWTAGFRHRVITDWVQHLVQRVVAFFKSVGRLLNPFNLFNKAKRDELFADISEEADLFPSVTTPGDMPPPEKRKWWQFD